MYHRVTQSIEGSGRRQDEAPRGRERDLAREDDAGRDELPSSDREKKERVLHTRVPAVLERELKRFADNLRVPVSNLVRTILEDALNVADAATENVEERLKKAARTLEKERERLRKRVSHDDPLDGVLAFQEVTLAMPVQCARCERTIARGARAHLGLTDGISAGRGRVFVCADCLPKD
jgi:hypothetical protein